MRELSRQFQFKTIWLFLTITIGLGFLVSLSYITDSDQIYTCVFIIYYCICAISIWKFSGETLTPFFLFFLTFGLFIGGRFFAFAIGCARSSLWEPTFYISYPISHHRKIEILQYVIGFMLFSTIGYMLSKTKKYQSKVKYDIRFSKDDINYLQKIFSFIYPFLLLFIIYINGSKLLAAFQGGGYLSLYSEQAGEYTGGLKGIIVSSFYVIFGIVLTFGNAANKKRYLILFIINAIIMIGIGQRGLLGATFLLLLWLYSQSHKISLKKIIIICVTCVFLLLALFSFSIRASDYNMVWDNIGLLFSEFLYGQGVSLMVFDAARLVESYPIICYMKLFIPGAPAIVSMLTGAAIPMQDVEFTLHLDYELNPQLYAEGLGLGWTVLGDIFLCGLRNYYLFLCLSLLFSFTFGHIEKIADQSNIWKVFIYTNISHILMLPRSSLSTVIPYLMYIIFFLTAIRIVFYIKHKGNNLQMRSQYRNHP